MLRVRASLFLATLAWAGCKAEPEKASSMPTAPSSSPAGSAAGPATSIHAFTLKRLDGHPESLAAYKGKVLLVVNTASECGYTPQYEGLQALQENYAARGFTVLGFPSNDFGGQEPGSSEEIATFCKTRFGVTFPMFEKVATTGSGRAELYRFLTEAKGAPKWNFHKYLIDREGRPIAAFPSSVAPSSPELARAIDGAIAAAP